MTQVYGYYLDAWRAQLLPISGEILHEFCADQNWRTTDWIDRSMVSPKGVEGSCSTRKSERGPLKKKEIWKCISVNELKKSVALKLEDEKFPYITIS
jgi:hypothetical protein